MHVCLAPDHCGRGELVLGCLLMLDYVSASGLLIIHATTNGLRGPSTDGYLLFFFVSFWYWGCRRL